MIVSDRRAGEESPTTSTTRAEIESTTKRKPASKKEQAANKTAPGDPTRARADERTSKRRPIESSGGGVASRHFRRAARPPSAELTIMRGPHWATHRSMAAGRRSQPRPHQSRTSGRRDATQLKQDKEEETEDETVASAGRHMLRLAPARSSPKPSPLTRAATSTASSKLTATTAAAATFMPFPIMCLCVATSLAALLFVASPSLVARVAAESHRQPMREATTAATTTTTAALGSSETRATTSTSIKTSSLVVIRLSKLPPHESNSSQMMAARAAGAVDSRRPLAESMRAGGDEWPGRAHQRRSPKSPAVTGSDGDDDYTAADDEDDAQPAAVGTTPGRPADVGVSAADPADSDEETVLQDELEFRRRLLNASGADGLNRTEAGGGPQRQPATGLLAAFLSHIDKQWKFAEIVLIIAISAILNLVTIVGNIMVLISFKMDRSLQTVSNYFLLSLALADLLIGLISMPLYTLYLLLNYWPLGPLMCDIWLAIDYLNSNAAVLNMLIISFDRYFSVTSPLTYRAKRTTKHAILMISFAWLLSLTIWTPAIFTYPYYKGRTVQGTDKCEIEFVKANSYLTFVTAILAFYIPVAIMIYLYWRIWLETKKRYRDLTTLFLVSGVGAAAPTRLSRPQQAPPASTSVGPVQSAVGGGAQRPLATTKSSCGPRILLDAHGDRRRPMMSKGINEVEATSQAEVGHAEAQRGRDENRLKPEVSDPTSSVSSTHQRSGGSVMKQLGSAPSPNPKQLAASNTTLQAQNDTDDKRPDAGPGPGSEPSSGTARLIVDTEHPGTKPQAIKRRSPCELCPPQTTAVADQRNRSRGATRSRYCCCSTSDHLHGNHSGTNKSKTPSSEGAPSRATRNCSHCSILNCSYYCNCPAISRRATAPGSRSGGNQQVALNSASTEPVEKLSGVATTTATTTAVDSATPHKCLTSGSKSSLYYLLAEAASSPHQRSKIHPEVRANSVAETEPGMTGEPVETTCTATTEMEKIIQTKPASTGVLVDVATSPIRFEQTLGPSEAKHSPDMGVALPPSKATAASVWSLSPVSLEPEDCETRIVSHGNKFTFETNDPRLMTPDEAVAKARAPRTDPNLNETTGEGHQYRLTGTRQQQQQQPQQCCCKVSNSSQAAQNRHRPSACCGRHSPRHPQTDQTPAEPRNGAGSSSATNARHHYSRAGTKQGCSCADMMSLHDAECRACRPLGRTEPHHLIHHCHRPHAYHHHNRTHHHHHPHSHHHHHHHHHQPHQRLDKQHQAPVTSQRRHHLHGHHHYHKHQCKRCLARDKSFDSSALNQEIEDPQENRTEQEDAQQTHSGQSDSLNQRGSLPILDALDGANSNTIENCDQSKRTSKGAKKLSQKLTFSDVLQERSNSCVTLEGEQPKGSKGGSLVACSDGRPTSNSRAMIRPPMSDSEKAIQNIVKRNADRLRSAFDDDLDDQDSLRRSGSRESAPSSSANPRIWLNYLVPSIFRSRNRPVRYRTDNYRGYREDDADSPHCRDRGPRYVGPLAWFSSICCLNKPLQVITKHASGSSSSSSSSRHRDENNLYQTRSNPTTNSRGDHKSSTTGGACSQHSSTSSSKTQQSHHYHPIQPKSERKAAKTLSTLLLVFIVTWLPYNVLVLIKTLSGGEDQVPEKIWNFSYYLCYINSTINPLCYALCNAQFRRTYMRILKCRLSNEHNPTRRMVPIQSSSTWNKDLRLNSTSGGDCSTNSTTSHPQHHLQVTQIPNSQQAARHKGKQRLKGLHGRDNKYGPSSDSSAENLQTGHHHHLR